MLTRLVIALLVLCSYADAQPVNVTEQRECPNGWLEVERDPLPVCIKVVDEKRSWADARQACQADQPDEAENPGVSDLVTFERDDVFDFVRDELTQNKTKNKYWIGLHAPEGNDLYKWLDDEEFIPNTKDFGKRWKKREKIDPNCVEVCAARQSRYMSEDCSEEKRYICMFQGLPQPADGTDDEEGEEGLLAAQELVTESPDASNVTTTSASDGDVRPLITDSPESATNRTEVPEHRPLSQDQDESTTTEQPTTVPTESEQTTTAAAAAASGNSEGNGSGSDSGNPLPAGGPM